MASSAPSAGGSACDMQPARAGSLDLAGAYCGLAEAAASQQHRPRWPTSAACPAMPTFMTQCSVMFGSGSGKV